MNTDKYIHSEVEDKIYSYWEKNELFKPIKNTKKCYRYMGRILTDIKIGPSPLWLANRLEQHGIRSINNIVDVTNYVLLEYGHPLHAFDYDKLKDKKIIVRNAKDEEKIITLDGVERKLTKEDLEYLFG